MTTADLTPEQFIIGYIVDNADDHGEVFSRACITAAEETGFTERAVLKARHRSRSRIGTRKTRDGGWVWYAKSGNLLEDSGLESSTSAALESSEIPTVSWRLYPPDTLLAMGRCPVCSFHPPTQGHRDGCPQRGHN